MIPPPPEVERRAGKRAERKVAKVVAKVVVGRNPAVLIQVDQAKEVVTTSTAKNMTSSTTTILSAKAREKEKVAVEAEARLHRDNAPAPRLLVVIVLVWMVGPVYTIGTSSWKVKGARKTYWKLLPAYLSSQFSLS
jgi:hypothetical protein